MVAVSILATIGWSLLWTLLVLLGLLLLILLALLFLPLDLRLRLDADLTAPDWAGDLEGAARWTHRFRWGWGVVSGEGSGENLTPRERFLRVMGFRLKPGDRGRKDQRKPEGDGDQPSPKRGGASGKGGRRWWRDRDLLPAILSEAARFMRRFWRDLGLRSQGSLIYGFADPSITGYCEAIRWGAGVPMPLSLQPNFLRPCLIGQAELTGRIYGFELAGALLQALGNRVIRRRLAEGIRFRPLRYLIYRGG